MGSGSSTANIFLRKEERAIKVPQFWDLGQGFMGKGSGKGSGNDLILPDGDLFKERASWNTHNPAVKHWSLSPSGENVTIRARSALPEIK